MNDLERQPGSRCISVIIPTYGRAALLVEAIDSVLAQVLVDATVRIEVIVVDDGSTDDTAERVSAYGSRVRYLQQANGGVASARNRGIGASSGELICFLDSDDLWLPGKLECQLAFADAHADVGLIATEISPFHKQGKDLARSKAALYRIRNGMVVEHLLFGNWIQTSTVMVRREALEAAGGFDEGVGQFGEDWLLWMRIASAHPVHFIPEPLVCYRVHAASLTSHQPELQFDSLMAILDRLALLPQFQRRPELIARARYRICLGRGEMNLQAGNTALAWPKLCRAYRLQRLPLRAALLLGRTWMRKRQGQSGD